MIYGINAGFGEPIAHEVSALYEHRFRAVRQDVHRLTDASALYPLQFELQGSGITPLWIVRANQFGHFQLGEMVELLNEPDLYMRPEEYAELWNRSVDHGVARGLKVYAGSLSNLTRTALKWWALAWNRMVIKPRYVSIHRYPTNGGPDAAHRGFRRREEEVAALQEIIQGTPFAVTEFGYHTAWRWRWKCWPTRWDNYDVTRHVRTEWRFWKAMGATHAYLYQLNDGPGRGAVNKYGIRTRDSQWKPSASAHWTLL